MKIISYQFIIVEKEDGIAVITMNRPDKLNALNLEMQEEMKQELSSLAMDDEVKAIILTGAGRAFSAGGDIGTMKDAHQLDPLLLRQALYHATSEVTNLIWNIEKPIIAAVNGVAAGGSCNWALACDFVIASENARFGEVFIHVGLVPDGGGSWLLPRLVGLQKAKEIIMMGKMVPAKEAEQIGMVNKVVPQEEVLSAAKGYAKILANLPSKTLGAAKKTINKAITTDLREAMDYEMTMQAICFQTEAHRERVKAFLEKSK
ncbi:MAG: enoyl-CoA hydratase/isomerase family protein [Candidatus Jordarchaeum sp.]|uniref:enoyl-CoA hydratase/isomerase family protein n=1 Tax=Candidatus Jordarchaeum sp. TaxID=2823881 RepID=UPI00404B15BE